MCLYFSSYRCKYKLNPHPLLHEKICFRVRGCDRTILPKHRRHPATTPHPARIIDRRRPRRGVKSLLFFPPRSNTYVTVKLQQRNNHTYYLLYNTRVGFKGKYLFCYEPRILSSELLYP